MSHSPTGGRHCETKFLNCDFFAPIEVKGDYLEMPRERIINIDPLFPSDGIFLCA